MIACPITSKVKHYPFEVVVRAKKIDGVVLSDQVKNLDWSARNLSFIEKAPYEVLEQTQEYIDALIRG